MDYDNFLELVKKRRSIRFLKKDPIPDEYIEKMIEAARFAPSACNAQATEYVVVKKQEIKDKIVAYYKECNSLWYSLESTRPKDKIFPRMKEPPGKRFAFEDAPVFIVVCGNVKLHDIEPVYVQTGYMPYIIYSDLAICSAYMHLAATSLGLACQWVSGPAHPQLGALVKNLLGIPQSWECEELIAVGYPAVAPIPRHIRSSKELIHYNHMDNPMTEKQSEDYLAKLRQWWDGKTIKEIYGE